MVNRCKSAAPFLKWVGGKRQLLPVLRRFYPDFSGRYFEPFVGSGAVFFDLLGRGALCGHQATLSDANADLIGCYQRVRDSVDDVIGELDRLAAGHAAGGGDHYRCVRDTRFNPLRAAWRASGAEVAHYSSELAAMLIYLNRTGYNGLFRLNASGEYNVPPGRYDNPTIVDRARLTAVSAALSTLDVDVQHAPFDRLLDDARAGDFAYFDPPYAPLSKTANFRGYTGRGFSNDDQQRLQQVLLELSKRGVHVLLSNSTARSVSALYERDDAVKAAGLRAWRFPARRAVNSNATRRGAVEELVVSNVRPRRGDHAG